MIHDSLDAQSSFSEKALMHQKDIAAMSHKVRLMRYWTLYQRREDIKELIRIRDSSSVVSPKEPDLDEKLFKVRKELTHIMDEIKKYILALPDNQQDRAWLDVSDYFLAKSTRYIGGGYRIVRRA